MGASTAIQKALYDKLSAAGMTVVDVARQASDGSATTGYPYVEIGTVIISPFDTFEATGHEVLARIHTRSRSAGMAECKGLQDDIYTELHRGSLTITGFNLINLVREQSECSLAPDGSFHGVCEYRGLMNAG